MSIVPADLINAQRFRDRLKSVNEVEPKRELCRQVKRHADAVCEWGAADGDLCFYRAKSLLAIIRERKGVPDGAFLYATPGTLDVEWAQIVGVAWKLRGEVAVKTDGSWRKRKR